MNRMHGILSDAARMIIQIRSAVNEFFYNLLTKKLFSDMLCAVIIYAKMVLCQGFDMKNHEITEPGMSISHNRGVSQIV
jgi:hypothetical protein